MGWLRWVGCLKIQVSLQNTGLFCRALLQKRPIFLRDHRRHIKSSHKVHRHYIKSSHKLQDVLKTRTCQDSDWDHRHHVQSSHKGNESHFVPLGVSFDFTWESFDIKWGSFDIRPHIRYRMSWKRICVMTLSLSLFLSLSHIKQTFYTNPNTIREAQKFSMAYITCHDSLCLYLSLSLFPLS